MFEVVTLVTGHDDQGRAVGRLLHGKPYAMPNHVLRADGRVVDGEGHDLGTTVIGDVAISDELYPPPEHEHWPWDTSRSIRTPPSWDLRRMPAPPALPAIDPGDLLLAKHGRGWPDDRSEPARDALRLHGCTMVGRGMSPADAAAWVAAALKGRMSGPKGPDCIAHDTESVREARKPNEAVVVLHRSGTEHKYNTGRILTATEGWFFHRDGDDAAEAGIDVPHGEYGLFVLLDGKPWTSGDGQWEEYDSGVEGNLVPATPEHLAKFGLTMQEVGEHLADVATAEGHAEVLATGLRAQGYEELAAAVEKAEEASRTTPDMVVSGRV